MGLLNSFELFLVVKDRESFQYLEEVNEKSKWIWNVYYKYAMGYNALGTAVVGSIVSTVLCLTFVGEFNRDILYLQFKLTYVTSSIFNHFFKKKSEHFPRLPWNQSTPLGYFGETCYSVLTCESYLIVNGAIMLLFVSLAWHHHAFYKMFQISLSDLEHSNGGDDTHKMHDLIRFHNMVKR